MQRHHTGTHSSVLFRLVVEVFHHLHHHHPDASFSIIIIITIILVVAAVAAAIAVATAAAAPADLFAAKHVCANECVCLFVV